MSEDRGPRPALARVSIRCLSRPDSKLVADFLQRQPAEYLEHFHPFAFDQVSVAAHIGTARQDTYFGVWIADELAAIFMLRGLDEGYTVPSYGVVVAEQFRNFGLGRLTLQLCKCVCRLGGIQRLMLKVHPDNAPARAVYESEGFVLTGADPTTGHLVFHADLAVSCAASVVPASVKAASEGAI
jgi:GNAT superfamily N-acetyltransferase